MTTTTNTPRLLAAAKEFNIGKDTLVEFLTDKGFEINSNPSTKLTEQMYNVLQVEFAQDKLAKRRSEEIALPKGSLLDGLRKSKEDLDISIKDRMEEPQNTKSGPAPKVEEKSVVVIPAIVEKSTEKPIKPITTPNTDEEIEGTADPEYFDIKAPKIEASNILGKINLDDLNLSSRPPKKAGMERELEKLKEKKDGLNKYEIRRIAILERIIACKNAEHDFLDLAGLDIEKIPSEIYSCKKLEKINLSNNKITDISLLGKIVELKEIDLSNNTIFDIQPLSNCTNTRRLSIKNNNINNVECIANMLDIDILDVSQNKLNEISIFHLLLNLSSINLSYNEDLTDITPLFVCTKLKELIARNNSIHDIDGIGALTQLINIDLTANRIHDIHGLSFLSNLKVLMLGENDIVNIDILGSLNGLKTLQLNNNKIIDISSLEGLINEPKPVRTINIANNFVEDIKLSNDISENNYLLLREYFLRKNSGIGDDTQALNFVQLMVLGNGEAGKTSVLHMFRDMYKEKERKNNNRELIKEIAELPTDSTHGSIHYYWRLNFTHYDRKSYILLVKDFGGQEYYHHFHPMFYHPKAIYWIINPLIANNNEIENGSHSPTYWFNNIKHYLQFHHELKESEFDFRVWLINSKIDMVKVLPHIHYEYFNSIHNICSLGKREFNDLNYLQKSKYQAARDQLYYELREQISNSSKDNIVSFSVEIFHKLNELNTEDNNHPLIYSKEAFKDFLLIKDLATYDVLDRYFETILNDLRYLGICLYFPSNELLKENVYLYPQKIAASIFSGILSKENLKKSYGVIGKEIPVKEKEMQSLLQHFEIIFKDGGSGDWIIPQYLPKVSEYKELIAIATDGLNQELVMDFGDFMPQGIMSRLICYFGQNPYKKWYWRDGIFFTHNLVGKGELALQKAVISTNWEDGFSIKIKATSIEELEKIFIKVLLSYYNKPLQITDDQYSQADEKLSETREQAYLSWLATIKTTNLNLALSLNNDGKIHLSKFKELICTLNETGDINVEQSKYNPYAKVYEYLPFLQYIVDTKEFQNKFNPKKIFISYSHKDSDIRGALETHLKLMVRTGMISTWHDMRIDVGSKWDEKIESELRSSDVIILLISSDFFASEYIWHKELPIIVEKITNESATVIPILCRHCISDVSEIFSGSAMEEDFRFKLSQLQGLPIKDNKLMPVHSEAFKYIDEAYEQIAKSLVRLIGGKRN